MENIKVFVRVRPLAVEDETLFPAKDEEETLAVKVSGSNEIECKCIT